jgi:amphi-Trp domain-containing protein
VQRVIENGTRRARGQIWWGRAGRRGSEALVKLMELKDKTTLSREEAAARLHAIADELASGNDVVIEREDMRFVAHVPDQVNLKVEFEIEDDGAELEIELTW